MEHSRIKKRNVALIEKCVMSSIGIESLFRKFAGNPYKLHTYTSQESFQDAMSRISFAAVIFSFSAMRSERREGLSCLTELAIKFPRTRRLVIADDDIEARLIGSLSSMMFFSSTAVIKSLVLDANRLLTVSSALTSFSLWVSMMNTTRFTSVSMCSFLALL